jgi:hypothetical protein
MDIFMEFLGLWADCAQKGSDFIGGPRRGAAAALKKAPMPPILGEENEKGKGLPI